MACAWLIRRQIDPKAQFLFVPAGSQELPAGAEPFDIPGAKLSHPRGHAKVDRVACPWLIRKFVDPAAEFLFVPADQVMDVARQAPATPYDVPGVELGHHGKECSFEAILKRYGLTADPALVLLGRI